MKKKKSNEPVCCYDCKHAELMQWFRNPIIAGCKVRGEREVAQTKRKCERFEPNNGWRKVKHYDKYEDE